MLSNITLGLGVLSKGLFIVDLKRQFVIIFICPLLWLEASTHHLMHLFINLLHICSNPKQLIFKLFFFFLDFQVFKINNKCQIYIYFNVYNPLNKHYRNASFKNSEIIYRFNHKYIIIT